MADQSSDLNAVRRLLLSDADTTLPSARQAAWRQVRHRTIARRKPARSRRLIAAAAATALVVTATTLGVGDGGRDGIQLPGGVQVAAAAVLENAADLLRDDRPLTGAQARVVRVDSLQLVTRRDSGGHDHAYVVARRWEQRFDAQGRSSYEELADGAPRFATAAAKTAFEDAFGPYSSVAPKPRIVLTTEPQEPNPNTLGLSAQEVLNLPTEASALQARLARLAATVPSDESSTVADMAIRLLVFGPTPPAVRAGLAELLAATPGLHKVGVARVGDREGDVLALDVEYGFVRQIVVDRQTGELLEERTILTHADPNLPGVRPGTVLNATAYTTAVVTSLDAPGHPAGTTPSGGPQP